MRSHSRASWSVRLSRRVSKGRGAWWASLYWLDLGHACTNRCASLATLVETLSKPVKSLPDILIQHTLQIMSPTCIEILQATILSAYLRLRQTVDYTPCQQMRHLRLGKQPLHARENSLGKHEDVTAIRTTPFPNCHNNPLQRLDMRRRRRQTKLKLLSSRSPL